jgi:hypothetical protein
MALRIALCERPASLRPLRRAVLSASAAVSRALVDGVRSVARDADRLAEAEPLRAEPVRAEPLREEALRPADAERPRAVDPDDDRLLPEPDRPLLEPEDDRPLLGEPEDDRALAERDWPVLPLRLRVLPLPLRLRVLPLPPEPEPDEPPLRDERDCVLAVSESSDEDDFEDLARLELPRGLVADISTSRGVECAGSRWSGRTGYGRQ